MHQVLDEEWFARNPKVAHDKMLAMAELIEELEALAKAAGAGHREEERRRRRCEAALRVARGYVLNVVEAGQHEWNRRDLATVDAALSAASGDEGEGQDA